jgi:hypothetical protein
MIWIILAFGANFICCWLRIRETNLIADPCGSGSETLILCFQTAIETCCNSSLPECGRDGSVWCASTGRPCSEIASSRSWINSGTAFLLKKRFQYKLNFWIIKLPYPKKRENRYLVCIKRASYYQYASSCENPVWTGWRIPCRSHHRTVCSRLNTEQNIRKIEQILVKTEDLNEEK